MSKRATTKSQKIQFGIALAFWGIVGAVAGVALTYGLMALGVNL